MKKKVICILLTLVMIIGLTACGKNEAKVPDTGSDSTGETEQEGNTAGKDLPTVVWGFVANGGNYEADNPAWPTNVFKDFQEAVRDKAGVNLEFKSYADNQAFELALASGDLPDMIEVPREYCTALLNGNNIMALDDYLKLAPNLVSVSDTRIAAMRKYYSKNNDGKLYFWTPFVGTELNGSDWWNGMTIRWDYYKELGYPEVKTEDDFLNVVKQAVDKHPTTEDGKKVYGVATYSDGTLWGWWIRGCMYGYHNITDAYSMDIRDNANVIINNFTDLDSPVWRDIRYYYKANQMGIFDPDSLTMKGDDLNAKATNGQLVSTICTWYGGSLRQNEMEKDPDTLAEYKVLPVEGQYNWGNQHSDIGWPFYNGVNSKTEHIEEIMKIIDYVNTPEGARMGLMGKEGGIWETVDGVPRVKQEAIDLRNKVGGDEATIKTSGLWPDTFGVASSTICKDGGMADLWNDPNIWEQTLTPAQKDFADHYGVQVPSQAAGKLIEEGKAYDKQNMDWDLMSLLPSTPQDIARIDASCIDIMVKAIPRLVLAKDQAEFDQVQKETLEAFEKSDVQTSIDWWKTQETEIRQFLDSVEK